MSSEKNDFLNILENTITHDIEIEDLQQITKRFNLSGFLRSNSERFFELVINNKYVTKVIFEEEVLNQYLSQHEDQDINSLNSKKILNKIK